MTRRKKKKKSSDFKTVLVYMALVFTGLLFILKLFVHTISWLDVFAPLLVVFLLLFLLSVLKAVLKKI